MVGSACMASEPEYPRVSMVLATRCPNCGTSFRVVPDQLKLRGGWVRCGVCSTTFDSNNSLTEVELPVVAPATPVAPVVAEPATAHHAPAVVDPIIDHPAVLRMRGARPAVAQDPDPLSGQSRPAPAAGPYPDLYSELPRRDKPVAPLRADPRDDASFVRAESTVPFQADRKLVFGSEPRSEFLAEPAKTMAGIADFITDETLKDYRHDNGNAPREALSDVTMLRFDMLQRYSARISALFSAAMRQPRLSCAILRALRPALKNMMHAARIDVSSAAGEFQLAGMGIVYLAAFMAWRRDDTPDLARTMGSLDRRLRQAENIMQNMKHT